MKTVKDWQVLIAALLAGSLWAEGSVTVRSVSPDGDSDMTAAILSTVESVRAAGGGTPSSWTRKGT